MKRYLEPVDLIVAVGVFATVLGGFVFFMAANGTLEAGMPQSVSFEQSFGTAEFGGTDPMEAMTWIQPALGQALVDDYILEQRTALKTTRAVTDLNLSLIKQQSLDMTPYAHIDHIVAHAEGMDAEQAGRAQYVAGRFIVASTARGVKAGVLSPSQLGGPFNRRIIETADATIDNMNGSYAQTRDPMLGRTIVDAALRHIALTEQLQHRLGTAITQVVQIQDGYDRARGEVQGQLASVALASVHTEQIADRFAKLAGANFAEAQPAFSAPRSWPDIPYGLLMTMGMILIGLFLGGLTLQRAEPEPLLEMEAKPLPFRKTA